MKTTFKLFISTLLVLLIFPCLLIAQESTYKSKVSKDTYVEMTLRIEDGVAYYSLSPISADPRVFASVYDLSGGERTDDGGIIPNEGVYYFIPFNGTSPRVCAGDWSINCSCYGNNGNGTCNVSWSGGSCLSCVVNSGCSHCEGEFIHGLVHVIGGGVIVKASSTRNL